MKQRFGLALVTGVLMTPSGPEHLSAAYDFSGDNRVCVRSLAGDTSITFMDNVVR